MRGEADERGREIEKERRGEAWRLEGWRKRGSGGEEKEEERVHVRANGWKGRRQKRRE